jgi:hypothetical protein
MQDFLSLGNEARMNYPGNPSGNWTWRMPDAALSDWLAARIDALNYLYSRKKVEAEPESLATSQKAEDYFLWVLISDNHHRATESTEKIIKISVR